MIPYLFIFLYLFIMEYNMTFLAGLDMEISFYQPQPNFMSV